MVYLTLCIIFIELASGSHDMLVYDIYDCYVDFRTMFYIDSTTIIVETMKNRLLVSFEPKAGEIHIWAWA